MANLKRLFNQARRLHQQGRLTEAERLYRKIHRQAPRNAEVLSALGHVQLALKQFDEARRAFEKSLSLDTKDGETWFALGFAFAELGQTQQAETAYRRAREINPASLDALNNLAGILQTQGRAKDAAALYREALALAPGQTDVRANLALVLEMINDLAESATEARRVLAAQPTHPAMALLIAQLALRAGDHEGAGRAAAAMIEGDAPPKLTAEAWHVLGQTRDRQGQFDLAFAAFTKGNDLMAQSAAGAEIEATRYRRYVAAYRAQGIADAAAPRARDRGRRVAFFVGFPRSGTTLMEDILGAHPAVVTTGEHSPLDAARAEILAHLAGADFPAALGQASASQLDSAVEAYWQAVSAGFDGIDSSVLFVDKLPLNIVEVGLIERLFPTAPILVALRDPRDVCLSCFMQHFSLNDAMANFLTLGDTTGLYAAVMGLWRCSRGQISNPWMEYRYEDLVANPQAVLQSVFAFLGLAWDADLLERRLKPSARYIATPSRDAVARPISAGAVGRWRHYQSQLARANADLAPFVAEFDYAPE